MQDDWMFWDYDIDLTGEQVVKANLHARREGSPGSDTYHEYHPIEGKVVIVDAKGRILTSLGTPQGDGWHHRMACTCPFCLMHPAEPFTSEQVAAAGRRAYIPGLAYRYLPSEGFQRNTTADMRAASPHWESIHGDLVPRGGWRHDEDCECELCAARDNSDAL